MRRREDEAGHQREVQTRDREQVREPQPCEGVLHVRGQTGALAQRERAQERAARPRAGEPLVELRPRGQQPGEGPPALAFGHARVQGRVREPPRSSHTRACQIAHALASARVRERARGPQPGAHAKPLARECTLDRGDTLGRRRASQPDRLRQPHVGLPCAHLVEVEPKAAGQALHLPHARLERRLEGLLGASPRGGVQTLGQTEGAGCQRQAERAGGAKNRLAGGARAQREASGPEHERGLVRHDGLIGEQDARDLREGQPGKQATQGGDPGTGAGREDSGPRAGFARLRPVLMNSACGRFG